MSRSDWVSLVVSHFAPCSNHNTTKKPRIFICSATKRGSFSRTRRCNRILLHKDRIELAFPLQFFLLHLQKVNHSNQEHTTSQRHPVESCQKEKQKPQDSDTFRNIPCQRRLLLCPGRGRRKRRFCERNHLYSINWIFEEPFPPSGPGVLSAFYAHCFF